MGQLIGESCKMTECHPLVSVIDLVRYYGCNLSFFLDWHRRKDSLKVCVSLWWCGLNFIFHGKIKEERTV